jgi:hypothetical protein
MAIFKDNNLSGSVGNLVFYNCDGQNRVRSKSGKRNKKRGQPADPNTTIFGIVSANGTPMLNLLSQYLLFPFTLSSYNDGRGWMRNHYAANNDLPQWDISARPNDMCQLNAASDLRDMLFISIAVTDNGAGKLLVSIPAMNPVRDMKKLPAQTASVNIKLAALHSGFDGKSAVHQSIEQYSLPYENTGLPAKEIIIDTKAPAGNLAIVAMAIEPFAEGKPLAAEWLPAAIIAMGRLK